MLEPRNCHEVDGTPLARVLVSIGILAATTVGATAATGQSANATGGSAPTVVKVPHLDFGSPAPLSTNDCLQSAKVRCYSPIQLQMAYRVTTLLHRGIDGRGRMIAIVDSFGSPTIASDLRVFDKQWHLPNPALRILPVGRIPRFNRKNAKMMSWAQETSLDVEYAHALAPRAAIDLIETPVAETEGLGGFPQMVRAERALIATGKPDVISQSLGATENTLPGFASHDITVLKMLRAAVVDAQVHHVTMVASSGDTGTASPGPDGVRLYRFPAVAWPASDPLVTAVGGTQLTLNQAGARVAKDRVWNDHWGASGGGRSGIFGRPGFQAGVAAVTGKHRGMPDISMSASISGAVWTYGTYANRKNGWQLFGGTSEAAPLFAAIVVLADQMARHSLGDINPRLYALAARHNPAVTGIIPVTRGENGFARVPGFRAGPGYNLAVGWGTIDAAVFVPALARR